MTTIPTDQNRPPAGPLGDHYATMPSCEQLAWLPIQPQPDAPHGGFVAQFPHPDGGEPIQALQWIAGKPGETRTDAEAAASSFGVCKDEGVTIAPMMTHEAVAKLQAPFSTQGIPWGRVTVGFFGAALLCIAIIAFVTDYLNKDNEDPQDTLLDELL